MVVKGFMGPSLRNGPMKPGQPQLPLLPESSMELQLRDTGRDTPAPLCSEEPSPILPPGVLTVTRLNNNHQENHLLSAPVLHSLGDTELLFLWGSPHCRLLRGGGYSSGERVRI